MWGIAVAGLLLKLINVYKGFRIGSVVGTLRIGELIKLENKAT